MGRFPVGGPACRTRLGSASVSATESGSPDFATAIRWCIYLKTWCVVSSLLHVSMRTSHANAHVVRRLAVCSRHWSTRCGLLQESRRTSNREVDSAGTAHVVARLVWFVGQEALCLSRPSPRGCAPYATFGLATPCPVLSGSPSGWRGWIQGVREVNHFPRPACLPVLIGMVCMCLCTQGFA